MPKREFTTKRIEAERRARSELKKKNVFVWVLERNGWKEYPWKNKPISDWLKDIGFAVTLIPLNTNWKKVLKPLDRKVTERNYEEIEDALIEQVCRKLGILPCQLDKIIYNNANQITDKLKRL